MKCLTKISVAILLINLLNSCDEKRPDVKWNYSKNEIISKDYVNPEKLSVDIYLDVTTSMKGFAINNSTNYSKLIEDLEATCLDLWKKAEINRFKFGKTVEKIQRDELISARTSQSIYSGLISTATNFDDAVSATNPQRVSIIITDLFYPDDVNRMVKAFKDNCIQKSVEIGVIGLTSNFNGEVCDVKPCVTGIKKPRPFYVLIMGDKANINTFFKAFKNKPYINSNQFYLITNKPVEDFSDSVLKDRECKTLNKQSLKEDLKDFGTVFNFRMKKEEKNASFNLVTTITPNQYLFPFTDKNLKIDFYKKSGNQKDSSLTNEITVKNLKMVGNKVIANIDLVNNDPEGKFSYLGYITFDNTVPPSMPAWIINYDTEDFRQDVNEDKTLHLSKLLAGITTYNITCNQPKLAKFYINIEKQ